MCNAPPSSRGPGLSCQGCPAAGVSLKFLWSRRRQCRAPPKPCQCLASKMQRLVIGSRCCRFLQEQRHGRNPLREREAERIRGTDLRAGVFAWLWHGVQAEHGAPSCGMGCTTPYPVLLGVLGWSSEAQRDPKLFWGSCSITVNPSARGRCWGQGASTAAGGLRVASCCWFSLGKGRRMRPGAQGCSTAMGALLGPGTAALPHEKGLSLRSSWRVLGAVGG